MSLENAELVGGMASDPGPGVALSKPDNGDEL